MRAVLIVDRALRRRAAVAGVAAIVAALTAILIAGTGYRYRPLEAGDLVAAAAADARATAELARMTPRGVYIVVDRANNRLHVRRGDTLLLDAACSAGSGTVLEDAEGNRRWQFDTPAGIFHVRSRTENPVWRKPDWAFVEEGLPIPTDPAERIEYGVLGEYALHLGDGYMIHGTLYERLLGRSVTHGCVRLGRDDLRVVWRSAPVGTPVYVY